LIFLSSKIKTTPEMKSVVIWITGLSGAGKTTIARNIIQELRLQNLNPITLDGDNMRFILQQQGYDENSRKEYNYIIGRLAASLEADGHIVVVALISPYREIRDNIRQLCKNFCEVYVSTDLETCKQRDPKGLYKKALAGEIENFTGITAPYEPPLNPEVELNTTKLSEKECTQTLITYLNSYE
jgi:adenylylsulfate kinase